MIADYVTGTAGGARRRYAIAEGLEPGTDVSSAGLACTNAWTKTNASTSETALVTLGA